MGNPVVPGFTNSKKTPPEWERWFERGWHDVSASKWIEIWFPERIRELARLDTFASKHVEFTQVARREKRNVLQTLIRAQHVLPWFDKGRTPFFREERIEPGLKTPGTAFDHPIPVEQLKSSIEMALEHDDIEQALVRLVFAWLCPSALLWKDTHTNLTQGSLSDCHDFNRPLSRYADLQVFRFDGTPINVSTYSLCDLITDIVTIEALQDAAPVLRNLDLPATADVIAWTRENVRARPKRKGPAEPRKPLRNRD